MTFAFRSVVLPIRAKVDEVYRKLNQLCDILDEKSQVSHDPNPHGLMICESNELLYGLKNYTLIVMLMNKFA
jgi:hypothetical protein